MSTALQRLPPSIRGNTAARALAMELDRSRGAARNARQQANNAVAERDDAIANLEEVSRSHASPMKGIGLAASGAVIGGLLNGVLKSNPDDFIRPSDFVGAGALIIGIATDVPELQWAGAGPIIAAAERYGEKGGRALADGALKSVLSSLPFGGGE